MSEEFLGEPSVWRRYTMDGGVSLNFLLDCFDSGKFADLSNANRLQKILDETVTDETKFFIVSQILREAELSELTEIDQIVEIYYTQKTKK